MTRTEIMPFNPVTEWAYRGNNVGILIGAASLHNYSSNHWAGFDQWNRAGRRIKAGQHGTRIVIMKTKKLEDGTIKSFPSTTTVFNWDQTVPKDTSS